MRSARAYLSEIYDQLYWRGVVYGLIAMLLLGLGIALGSRNFDDFDSALIGYTFASLFSVFGIVYRYSVWLTKPSTKRYWKKGWMLFLDPGNWGRGKLPGILIGALFSKILIQDFVWRRGKRRYVAHILMVWGCVLAALVTFPLVFGWIHFETGTISPIQTYKVILLHSQVQELPLNGLLSWLVFHALVISSFLVIPGVMLAIYRRMTDPGEAVIQKFNSDFLPLILLFSVAFSGLLLWVDYEWLEGYYYSVIAQFHALTVIGTLIYLPFGKLFHIFQRPASLGIALYRTLNMKERQTRCPVTGEEFVSAVHIEDLKEVLPETGFDYSPSSENGVGGKWFEISPRGRRMLIGRSHSKTRGRNFS